ncbi:unnamed protein product [Trichogramma brassicae]|uniref:Vacuolar protein sorting-associated protein 62 n=1 Tax=Trichogramma brassicae TaxID=86971 RepID=A0A6H5IP82_9HYME|nr:unnamed protein product [Trichogramma brassicae]
MSCVVRESRAKTFFILDFHFDANSISQKHQNKSSFLHGRRPAGEVPIYALVKNCLQGSRHRDEHFYFKNTQDDHVHDDPTKKTTTTNFAGLSNELLPLLPAVSPSSSIETNNVVADRSTTILRTARNTRHTRISGKKFLQNFLQRFLQNCPRERVRIFLQKTKVSIRSARRAKSHYIAGPAAIRSQELLDSNALSPGRRLVRSRPVFTPSAPPSDLPVVKPISSSSSNNPGLARPYDLKRRKLKKKHQQQQQQKQDNKQLLLQDKLHFHVTYWMFYPFSEGKAVCVLDLGFLGSWPIPSLGGVCLGKQREYGSHVGDWEHVSLYFKGKDHPLAMYVSAHDAGAFYRYEPRANTFLFESQETRKGIFQKPNFPERVYTAEGSHPVLFSARGSHGLWTAPGKHKFVRLPRLYDESGFGTAWPTWHKLELLSVKDLMPGWMSFTGKWGNPKSNCHPLARLGFNICEFVDGPTGIPMKKNNFRC